MSNALYNRMKTIDNTRKDLKNLLNNKGVDTTGVEALSSLVGMVGQLSKPSYHIDDSEVWEGITRKDAPTDYYKGDDDWRSVIDLHAIMEADTTSYYNKSIWLIRVSDNPSDTIKLYSNTYNNKLDCSIWGFQYCKFSDSDSVTTISSSGTTHTWDTSKDIVAENGERFRYIICYGSSSYNSLMYASTNISFEAALLYSGTFGTVSLNGEQPWHSNENSMYTNTVGTIKYIEITDKCSISNLRWYSYNYRKYTDYYQSRIRTIIIDGNVTSAYGTICGNDLEYLRYTGANSMPFTIATIRNNDISTYIYLKNVSSLSVMSCNNMDVYVDSIKSLGSNSNNTNVRYSIYSTSSTSIGADAFSIGNNNVQLDLRDIGTVAENAFLNFKDNKLKIGSINGAVGNFAFYNSCLNQDIVFGPGCTSIGHSMFGLCNVHNIDLSNSSITTIPNSYYTDKPSSSSSPDNYYGAFRYCDTIESISLPKTLKNIGDYAFNNCTAKQINIPAGLTTINTGAFRNCVNLEEITLPNTVTSIGNSVFYNCKSLTSVTLPNSITSLGASLFSGCTSITSINLPPTLSSIGSNCFDGCTALTRLTLPKNIISIPSRCFNRCTSLISLTCDEGVIQSIYSYAFADCENLEEIFDLSAVTITDIAAFMNCKKLEIIVPPNITNANANSFAANNSRLNFSNTESINTTLLLRGTNWSLDNVLYFLQNLRDNTGGTNNSLVMGVPYSRISLGSDQTIDIPTISTNTNYTQYEQSVYSSYSNKYVLDTNGVLTWSDADTEGAVTVANYVASKNWTIS